MKAVLVFHRLDPFALQRAGKDHRRPSSGPFGLLVGGLDRVDVVAVDLDRVPPEGACARGVAGKVPSEHGLARLPEPVDVDNRDQVVEP